MLEGVFVEKIMTHSEIRAYPVEPQVTSGTLWGTEAIYRYGLRESTYPTLILVDEIADKDGNVIPSGHYELALSDERDFLILIEGKRAIAIIPVFKVEVDMTNYAQVKDKKTLKKEEKLNKEIEKTNQKRAKVGQTLIDKVEDDIYQKADIEYIPDGNYFLIRYERADVKAWGAIKAQ